MGDKRLTQEEVYALARKVETWTKGYGENNYRGTIGRLSIQMRHYTRTIKGRPTEVEVKVENGSYEELVVIREIATQSEKFIDFYERMRADYEERIKEKQASLTRRGIKEARNLLSQ